MCPTLLVMPAPNLVFRKVSSNPTTAPSGWRVPLAVEQMGEPRHRGGLCLNPDIYCKPNKLDSQARSREDLGPGSERPCVLYDSNTA